MYSLNVPVPGPVAALAGDLARELPGARPRERGSHTLVAKRLTGDQPYHAMEARLREAVSGVPPFAVRLTGLDLFEEAVTGSSPVVYITVESPGLVALHERMCEVFEPVDDLEGEDYTPHVTVARDGSLELAEDLVSRYDEPGDLSEDGEPIEWTVTELESFDAERGQRVSRLSLPA